MNLIVGRVGPIGRYNSRDRMQEAVHTGDREGDEVSGLLRAWSDGDQSALQGLTSIVYDELRRLAHGYMEGECSGHSLQTTALVNEAYMREW